MRVTGKIPIYTLLAWLWWLLVTCLAVAYYYLLLPKHSIGMAMVSAIPITSSLLLYYYGHQYLIQRYLLNNEVLRYLGFLVLLFLVQSVGSYNVNHYLFFFNADALPAALQQFRFFFTMSLVFDFATFLGIIATVNAVNTRKKLENVQSEHQKVRNAFLRSQINHHTMLNTMNSIYYLSISKPAAVSDAVLKTSDLLKYILVQTEKELVSLSEEINFLSSYIELQKLRLGNTRRVDYTLPQIPLSLNIPPMLLITLVENAFKYSATTISINIRVYGTMLELQCTNDITKTSKESNGIGLKNLRERLSLLDDGVSGLNVEERDNTFSAYLKLNLFL